MMRRLVGETIMVGVLLVFGGQVLTAEDPAAPASADTSAPAAAPAAASAPADDLAALIAKVAPPERFKDHAANFSAKEEEFEFQVIAEKPADKPSDKAAGAEKAGPPPGGKAKLWVVRDGPRVVAVYHPKASKLYVVASGPDKASEELDLPPAYDDGGNTFDGVLGQRLTTFPYCYGSVQAGDHKFAFTGSGRTLTLTDTTRWPERKKAEAVYTLTLRCDPVLGYVVEYEVGFKADTPTDEKGKALDPELLNFYPTHVYMQKWPDAAWRYEYTVCTPAGDGKQPVEGRYVGWVNDFAQSDRAGGLRLRNGGFTLFAADPDGAGPAVAATAGEGSLLKNDTGNLQHDQHYRVTLPDKPGTDGLYGVKAKFLYATLPPEVVRQVMEQMEVTDWRANAAMPLKVGRVEGAEDEEALLKGSLAYKDLPITDREFHTGTKSLMLLGGRTLRLDPSPPLEPGVKYRLDAWVKVTGRGAEARFVAVPAKWTPKGTQAAQQMSSSVKGEEGWKLLVMSFTSGPCGSTPWLYLLVSRSGTAYFDEVVISKIEKIE